MVKSPTNDTIFTTQVKRLLNSIYGRSQLKDSVLERAIAYYDLQAFSENHIKTIELDINELKNSPHSKDQLKLTKLENELRESQQELTLERHERFQHLYNICSEIITLAEGETFQESNRKSAQLLGTIQLLVPTEGKKVAIMNEQSKPLYKGVLCLRLLDRLCIDNALTDRYIDKALSGTEPDQYVDLHRANGVIYQQFTEQVKIPLLMAAILQDIGNFHPEAQRIIYGDSGTENPYRPLSVEQRKELLQINYRETVKYLVNGIGAAIYIGHSKVEREKFKIDENNKLLFIRHLLKSSVNPKLGIGNLLKIPQIYVSIVLSTKASYNYKLLPKVYQVLYQNAERGSCSAGIVDTLYKITGSFPQGYGVTYIPDDVADNVRYEYGIVTQLYPQEPEEPICRAATRTLTFIGYGQDLVVKKACNLYFTETAKQFSSISKERLNEILALLSSNYQERKKLDLLPRCWQPSEFFSLKNNQKLWSRAR